MQKENKYDVIIVGAGVAGLMLARFLNNSSRRVLLAEKRNTIKKLNNSIFGLNREPIEKFGLTNIILREYDRFAIGGRRPQDWFLYKHKTSPFVVVDFNKMASTFKPNCDVITNFEVNKAKHLKNSLSISSKDGQTYSGKIVVDCSGSAEIISTKLKIKDCKTRYDFYNISYELENCNIPDRIVNTPSFPFLGFEHSNVPFWIYPYSSDKCQFGKAEIVSKNFPLVKDNEQYLLRAMQKVKPYSTWFKNAKIIKKTEGLARQTMSKPIVADNFLSCGDAAGATTPLLGEGSRIGMEMAFLAADTIAKSFDFNDFSKEFLKDYSKSFNEFIGKYYFRNRIFKWLYLRYFTNSTFNILMKNLNNWTETEYIKFYRSELTIKMLCKLISLKLLLSVFVNVFKYHIINRNTILTKRTLN